MSDKQTTQNQPKVFISYSWTSDEHVDWVLDLAKRLVNNGVDVVIDRWDLYAGQDKFSFMERMVLDQTINKVLVVCDRGYAEKANKRAGGVGTESTIISQTVYNKVDQTKFLPVIAERDEQKKGFVPVFLESRIYYDLSDPRHFSEDYEELLRNLFGKPIHVKPPLGQPPAFLRDGARTSSALTYKRELFEEAIMKAKPHAVGLATDFFEAFETELEGMRITERDPDSHFDEQIFQSIEQFTPLRDEFIDFVLFFNRYGSDARLWEELNHFFMRCTRFLGLGQSNQKSNDNYRFILWELFLYSVASLVKSGRYQEAGALVSAPYNDSDNSGTPGRVYGYGVFVRDVNSLAEDRKRRLEWRYYEPLAEILRARATHPKVSFSEMRDVDYALFLRYWLNPNRSGQLSWPPRTLAYTRDVLTMPLFSRAQAKTEFAGLKLLLNVQNKNELIERINVTNFPHFEALEDGAHEQHRLFMNLAHLDTL